MFRIPVAAASAVLGLNACAHAPSIEDHPISDFQFLGSHNSYKLKPEPDVSKVLASVDPWHAVSLDYSNTSLTEQLNLGLRHLEIDVLEDSEGGAFARSALAPTAPVDPDMMRGGFKVLHLPDYDYRTTCLTFRRCLEEINNWADENPSHFPIFIHMNARTRSGKTWPELDLISELLDADVLAEIDVEIQSVIPSDRVVSASETEMQGWPTLREARGKLLFFLDGGSQQAEAYRSRFSGDVLRIVHTDFHGSADPVDHYTVIMDAREDFDEIAKIASSGFLVRTLADFNTIEARRNEKARFKRAAESGAQIISIERYFDDPALRPGFVIRGFPEGNWVRCAPHHPIGPCSVEE